MIKERVQRLLESLIIGYQRAISPRFPPCWKGLAWLYGGC